MLGGDQQSEEHHQQVIGVEWGLCDGTLSVASFAVPFSAWAWRMILHNGPEPFVELLCCSIIKLCWILALVHRSILTGEPDLMTLEVHAVFRNGSSPSSVRDWQRYLSARLSTCLVTHA